MFKWSIFKYQTCMFLGHLITDQEHQSSEQSLATYKVIREFIPFIALGLPSGDVVANSMREKKIGVFQVPILDVLRCNP